MTQPDSCAFPDSANPHAFGLTKREWLAGIICAGYSANAELARFTTEAGYNPATVRVDFAACAVKQTDALIAALNKNKE